MSDLSSKTLAEQLREESAYLFPKAADRLMCQAADEIERLQRYEKMYLDAVAEYRARGAADEPPAASVIPREPSHEMMQTGLYHSSHDSEYADVHSIWVNMWDKAAGASEPPSVGVTRLRTNNSYIAPVSDRVDELVNELQRQGMASLRASFKGMRVRIDSEEDRPAEPPNVTQLIAAIRTALAYLEGPAPMRHSAIERLKEALPEYTAVTKSARCARVGCDNDAPFGGECPEHNGSFADETEATPQKSCLHGGESHCGCFDTGAHPCCDCGASARETTACQHDLLAPNPTVTVDPTDPFAAHCDACGYKWRTRPVDTSALRTQECIVKRCPQYPECRCGTDPL